MPFGGMLGSTFNFVFETQLEALQDGDRLYYLHRTVGLNFLAELENNSFAKLIMANTDATHLPGLVFTTPGLILEVDQTKQFNDGNGCRSRSATIPSRRSSSATTRRRRARTRITCATPATSMSFSAAPRQRHPHRSEGDDTIWGDGGNDRIEGGDGNDLIEAGAGDDIITDMGGDDVIKGDDGNDVIQGGNGLT